MCRRVKNSIADSLSHTPVWFNSKKEKVRDAKSLGLPDDLIIERGMYLLHCFDTDSHYDTEFAFTLQAFSKQFELDNTHLERMASAGASDRLYTQAVDAVVNRMPHTTLEEGNEVRKMGGEFQKFSLKKFSENNWKDKSKSANECKLLWPLFILR